MFGLSFGTFASVEGSIKCQLQLSYLHTILVILDLRIIVIVTFKHRYYKSQPILYIPFLALTFRGGRDFRPGGELKISTSHETGIRNLICSIITNIRPAKFNLLLYQHFSKLPVKRSTTASVFGICYK